MLESAPSAEKQRCIYSEALTLAADGVQIAIFVLPVMVLVGWAIGKPFLLDNVEPFAALVLTLSVIHTYFVSSDGNSNWYTAFPLRKAAFGIHDSIKAGHVQEVNIEYKGALDDWPYTNLWHACQSLSPALVVCCSQPCAAQKA